MGINTTTVHENFFKIFLLMGAYLVLVCSHGENTMQSKENGTGLPDALLLSKWCQPLSCCWSEGTMLTRQCHGTQGGWQLTDPGRHQHHSLPSEVLPCTVSSSFVLHGDPSLSNNARCVRS